jgi:hypothetical protein
VLSIMRTNIFNLNKYILIPCLIFLIFIKLVYLPVALSASSVYRWDEYHWISRSYYFELLINRDFTNRAWDNYGIDGDPKLASFLYGAFLYPSYLKYKNNYVNNKERYDMVNYLIDHNFFDTYFMNSKFRSNYKLYLEKKNSYIEWTPEFASGQKLYLLKKLYGEKFQKTINIIYKTRTLSVVFAAASVVVVYYLGLNLFKSNSIVAVMLVFFYGFSKVCVENFTTTYTESIYMFFYLASVLILLNYLSTKNKNLNILLFGVVSSLCFLSKLSGIVLLVAYSIMLVLENIKLTTKIVHLLVVSLIFLTIYVLFTPSFLQTPFKYLLFQFTWTNRIAILQANTILKDCALLSFSKRMFFFIDRFFSFSTILRPFVLDSTGPFSLGLIVFGYIYGFILLLNQLLSSLGMYVRREFFNLSKWAIFFSSYFLNVIVFLIVLIIGLERYLISFTVPIIFISAYGIERGVRNLTKIYLHNFYCL